MKRLVACLLSIIMVMSAFCGCGKNEQQPADLKTSIHKISEKYDFSDLYSVEDKDELCLVYGLEADDVSDFFAKYSLTGVDSQEIVIIEGVDDAAADRIKSALEIRYNSKVNEAASYSPEQLELVRSSSVEKNGKVVSMIIDSNFEDIKSILNGK